MNRESPEFTKWQRDPQIIIENAFGTQSRHVQDFKSVRYSPTSARRKGFAGLDGSSESKYKEAHSTGLDHARAILQSMIKEIQDYISDQNEMPRSAQLESYSIWQLIHSEISSVARSRFESNHFADSVEAALKHVNSTVKTKVKAATGNEFDGADLMNRAFSAQNPIIRLSDLSTDTGRSIQIGYMQIFAGAMTGIRNPKAHENINIDKTRAIHFLFPASLLMYKLEESIYPSTLPNNVGSGSYMILSVLSAQPGHSNC